MTRRPRAWPCHIDPDLAHTASPCSRHHAPVPHGRKPGRGLIPATTADLQPDPEPKTTTPPAAPEATRSAPKRTRKAAPARPTPEDVAELAASAGTVVGALTRAGATYDAEAKAKALELIASDGIATAHKVTGVPKPTLSRWARAADVDVGATARARTATATLALEARVVETKLATITRLERILEEELRTHAELSALEGTVADLLDDARRRVLDGEQIVEANVGAFGVASLVLMRPDSQLGQLLGLLELTRTVSKRDVVGAWTRAVHDLQLLKGEATERGDLVVHFGIPRPDAAASDAAAVPERELAGGNA